VMEASNDIKIIKGRQLKRGDMDKIVVGYNFLAENKVFKRAMVLGDKLIVNGRQYEIVGVMSEVGNPQDDAQIYITIEAFEELYPASKDRYAFVMMGAQPGIDPEELAKTISEKLRKFKGQEKGKEDFYVQTFADAIAIFGNIITIINSVLYLIAMVSVFVASVNIMNTMYTAVLERTQEIGIMKSIGARNEDILKIFLFESGFLGLIGGLMGVFFGYAVASFGGAVAAASGYALLKPIFPWQLTIGCIVFATLIGTVSGLFPALQASKLKPVEALRYE
jgi:putative ABC transport system permease protein